MAGQDGPVTGTGVDGWRFEAASSPHRALPSVRARSAIAAALVVALALAGSAALMFYLIQRSLISSLREDQQARIEHVVDLVRVQGNPDYLDEELRRLAPEGQTIQVVQGDRILATSSYAPDQVPLTDLQPGDGQQLGEHAGALKITDTQRPFLVLTEGAGHEGQLYTVIIASSFQGQQESLKRVLQLLLFGFPVLVLVVGTATWVLVGRALRPVEQIRARVAGIGAERLAERVPVPQTRDEIARLAVTMNQMLDRLQQAQQAQRQFVSDASHELRSPLATLAVSLEVAAADRQGAAWHDLAGVMSMEVQRMSSLVDNLLLLAKADDSGLRARREDVDLDDVLSREVTRFQAASPVPVVAGITAVRVQGDELQLSQVIRNLMDNAARHARSSIGVRLATVQGTAVLIVEDDGPGIPESERARVFERFVRLDQSRDRTSGGSGLGLAIVAEVVRAHGGLVEIREAPSGGAQVIVQLPVVAEPEPESEHEAEHEAEHATEHEQEEQLAGGQPPSVSSR